MSVGSIKAISGSAIIKDINGKETALSTSSTINLGDSIHTSSQDDSVQILLANKKEIVLLGDDMIKFDTSITQASSFGDEAIFDMQSLQILLNQSKLAMAQEASDDGLESGFMLETNTLDTTNTTNISSSEEKDEKVELSISAKEVLTDKDSSINSNLYQQQKQDLMPLEPKTQDLGDTDIAIANDNPCLIDISDENLV